MRNDDPLSLQTLARLALGQDPKAHAIEFEGRWHDWGEIGAIARNIRQGVLDTGIGERQPIAFIPRNRPQAVAALLALIADGHVVRMFYPFQSPAAIARALEANPPALLLAAASEMGEAVTAVARDHGLAVLELHAHGATALPGLARTARTDAALHPAGPEIHVHTSGTTGVPKQVPFAYDMFFRSHVLPGLGLDADAGIEDARRSREQWRGAPPQLLTFPLGNITGLYSTLPTLLRGQRAVLADRFSIEGWHDWVVRFRPVQGGLPPVGIQMILDRDYPREDLASLKYMGTGAAPLDPAVQRAFEQRYGIPILLSYGATEFGGPVTAMRGEHVERFGNAKLGSVGPAMAGAKIRIVDPETGAECSAGEQGIVEVVSPRIGPEWIRTSDIGSLDADGFLFLHGRADGAIMRGGFKLVPETIEKALIDHPAIADVAVDRRRDDRLGELPVAVIRLSKGAEWPGADALERHVRDRLPATHIPVDWIRIDELPRNRSMKLDRPALRDLIDTGGGTAV